MPEIEEFFDEVDTNRSRRARELLEIKRWFTARETDPFGIASKAVVVLAYAQWEGFYNDCVSSYVAFLRMNGGRIRDTDWMMLVGAFDGMFQSLNDRRHSAEARRQFVADLREVLDCGYERFDVKVTQARSNLDFSRLRESYGILDFDIARVQKFRLRIDREIVLWRHQAAHGDQPDLSKLDVDKHIDLTNELLLIVSDQFQEAMLARLSRGAPESSTAERMI